MPRVDNVDYWNDVSELKVPVLLTRGGASPVVDDDDIAEFGDANPRPSGRRRRRRTLHPSDRPLEHRRLLASSRSDALFLVSGVGFARQYAKKLRFGGGGRRRRPLRGDVTSRRLAEG